MAGEKVSEYSIGDVNLSALMTTADAQRIGYHSVSLTEYATTTKPKIAAGSKVEVNGALFKFDSDETITETPSDGDVYVKLIPDGTSITAEFTNDVPTWDDEKQGWYESGTNNRYLNYLIVKADASYTKYKITAESLVYKIGHDVEIENKILNDLTVEDNLICSSDANGTVLTSLNVTGTQEIEFLLLKPITAYCKMESNSVSGGSYLYIYQDSAWREIVSHAGIGTTDEYNLHLNPAKYKIWAGFGIPAPPLFSSIILYCTGAYGTIDVTAANIIEVV